MAGSSDDQELEKSLKEIEENLRFCEENLKREVRLDLTRHILEELMDDVDDLRARRLPKDLRERVEELALKIKILYHRAEVLSSLWEKSRYYRRWQV